MRRAGDGGRSSRRRSQAPGSVTWASDRCRAQSKSHPEGVYAVIRPAPVRISAGPIPVPVLRVGRSEVRRGPVHLHAVRPHRLCTVHDCALIDILYLRTKHTRLDYQHDVTEGRRGREAHDADKRGLLAQAHRGAIPPTTGEQLTSRGVADPLDADQLTKPVEVLRRPDDSARCRLNAKIGEQISQRRLHLLRTFRRMSRRLDAHPVHTTRFAPPPLIFSNVPAARRRFFDGLTVMAPGMREDLLAFVSDRGTLLEPDAVEFLLTQDDAVKRLEAFLESCPETPFVVTLGDVMRAGEVGRKAAARVSTVPTPVRNVVETFIPASFRRLGERADDHDPDVRILRDITGHSTCEGTLADFTRYFRHRFQVLRSLLRSRRELAGAQEIAKARRSTREVRIIGMVADVRTTKNGHRILEIEDEADRIAVLLPSESAVASEIAVLDEVVGD